MEMDGIIKSIEEQKNLPNLNFSIKEKSEDFIRKLFYTLFDNQTPGREKSS